MFLPLIYKYLDLVFKVYDIYVHDIYITWTDSTALNSDWQTMNAVRGDSCDLFSAPYKLDCHYHQNNVTKLIC